MIYQPHLPINNQPPQPVRFVSPPPLPQPIIYQQNPHVVHVAPHMYPVQVPPNIQIHHQGLPHEINHQQIRNHQKSNSIPNHPLNNPRINLIQPPQLNIEQRTQNTSHQNYQQNTMSQSHNQHSQFQNYNRGQEQQWNNDAHLSSVYWEQRCIEMAKRFSWLYERFQIIKNQYHNLTQQMQKMDSEDQWHLFQQHHDQFHEMIEQMWQEISTVLSQNEQLIQKSQQQDTQNVWQQRYQQLLGKSLQQQAEQTQQIKAENYKLMQQYKLIYDNYHQLEEQVNYYRQKQGKSQNTQQLQSYRVKINNLYLQNQQYQKYIQGYEQRYNILKQQYQHVITQNQKHQKVNQVTHVINDNSIQLEQLKKQIQLKNNLLSNNSININKIQKQLQEKLKQLQQYKRKISQKDSNIQSIKIQLVKVEQATKKRLRQQFQRQKKNLQNKIKDLQHLMDQLKQQTYKSNDANNKVISLQKRLQSITYQNQQNIENIKKKNQQLMQYRGIKQQLQKLKQMQNQYYRMAQDRQNIAQALNRRNNQIQLMHRQLDNLTIKIQQFSSKKPQHSIKNLQLQIQDLNNQLRDYQAQFNKMKSIEITKNQYIFRLQDDIRITKQKLINVQQSLLMQRQQYKNMQLKLNTNNIEYQKRIKNLDYQFNVQIKQALEKQIAVLRKQNYQKKQNIRKLQQKQLILSSKIAMYQKQKSNFERDLTLVKSKQNQYQSVNENYIRKFKELQLAYINKQQDISQLKISINQINNQNSLLKSQIAQRQSNISKKDKIIKDLQYQLSKKYAQGQDSNNLKAQNTKLKIYTSNLQQQFERIKEQFQKKLGASKGLSSNPSKAYIQNNEKQIINILQKQNQTLKQQLANIIESTNENNIKLTFQPSNVNLNKRLNQFNLKLQSTLAGKNRVLKKSQQRSIDPQYRSIVEIYQREISQLRTQLKRRQFHNQSINSQKNIIDNTFAMQVRQQQQNLKQQITFYKKLVKDQQQRNQVLLKVNEQLKDKIQNLFKIQDNQSTLNYFKSQNKDLQIQNDKLKSKIRLLLEENKQIKLQINSRNSKITQQYQIKVLDLQLRLQQQQKKLSYLSIQKLTPKNNNSIIKTKSHWQQLQNIQSQNKKSKKVTIQVPSSKGLKQQFQSILGKVNQSPKQINSRVFKNSKVSDSKLNSRSYLQTPNIYQQSQVQKI